MKLPIIAIIFILLGLLSLFSCGNEKPPKQGKQKIMLGGDSVTVWRYHNTTYGSYNKMRLDSLNYEIDMSIKTARLWNDKAKYLLNKRERFDLVDSFIDSAKYYNDLVSQMFISRAEATLALEKEKFQ